MNKNKKIDSVDDQILTALKHNARLTNIELSKQIGLAPSATLDRTRRLEKYGAIQGYYTQINPEVVGLMMTAFVNVTVSATNWSDKTKKSLSSIDGVTEIYEITGSGSYLLKVETESTASLSTILKEKIGNLPEILSTNTTIVLSSETNL